MGFGFSSIEHAFASLAKDTVKGANLLSVVTSRISEASPEIEAVTEAIYPPAVLIERAAFALLGSATKSAEDIKDATKAKGLNLSLDEQSIRELQAIAKYLRSHLHSDSEGPMLTALSGLTQSFSSVAKAQA